MGTDVAPNPNPPDIRISVDIQVSMYICSRVAQKNNTISIYQQYNIISAAISIIFHKNNNI
jgi:hypothetical protein